MARKSAAALQHLVRQNCPPATNTALGQKEGGTTKLLLALVVALVTAEPPACTEDAMKIAVIGATGGVGAHVARLAVEQGHNVIALARDPSKVNAKAHEKKSVDLASIDVKSLASAIKGADFVLSCIGNRRGQDPIVANGTEKIMEAMSTAGVKRMALISSIGVGDSSTQLYRLGFGGWIFSAIFATILRSTKEDLNAAEAVAIGAPAGMLWGAATPHARPSGVSVVVVRSAGLSDAPGQGQYDVALSDGTVGASVAREDVARFMLTLATETKYDNGAVSVGGNAPRTGH